MDIIKQAAKFAAAAHHGQNTKLGRRTYIEHPAAVAKIVAGTGLDSEVVAAAWLHDVIEDCGVTDSDVTFHFGARVARLVVAMTDIPWVKGGPNRAARKAATKSRFLMLQGQDSIDAHTLKAADCLHNAGSIKEHDPSFWVAFSREVESLAQVLVLAHPGTLDALADILEVPHRSHKGQRVWPT